MMRFRLVEAVSILLAAWAGPAASSCPEPGVTGLYEGTVKTGDGTTFEVTLNVLCADGKLGGQLFTSVGDFPATSITAEAGRVAIGFSVFGAASTLELMPRKGAVEGAFTIAGDKGTAAFMRRGDALAAGAWEPRLDLTPQEWLADLATYAIELPKHHANAFFTLPRAQFDAAVADLSKRAATANGDEMFVGLQAITKSIGDGHTGLVAPKDRRPMPLEIGKFGDDFRVVATAPEAAKAMGAKVIKIGGLPIAEAWRRALTLAPAGELEQLRRVNALAYLARGYALHGLDITPRREDAVYTFEADDGTVFDLDLAGAPPGADVSLRSAMPDRSLSRQSDGAPFWCKDVGAATVYCDWRGYGDLATSAKTMFALLDTTHATKLIIDMRGNGGGDNTVGYAQVLKPLKTRADINRKGHLYVVIGAETFSAAMNNAAQFQDETGAILVGETIGEKPNSYQEPRQFRLPNSHLVVRASTLWYAFRKTGPNVVAPDKEIIPSWDDVKAGRDPVLDWVLAQKTD